MWQSVKNIYHLSCAILANLWFRFPSKGLIVIGVTGTDGKTTTTRLIYHILHKSGFNASMISSVGAIIGGKNYDVGFHVTTPSSFSLQQFISKIAAKTYGNKNYLVLETTSHALDQHRVFGIKFKVGVLTNVTHEHLDYHKTYANYVNTKAKLLQRAEVAITNRDDESYTLLNSKFKIQSSKFVTYGMGKDADLNPENFPFRTNLIGEFNKYNVLAAISACKALGIKNEDIRAGIESFESPLGREDIVYEKDFTVMIDFAHTPNAFDQILSAIRPSVKGKLIHVFGSAGLRDRTKRPIMGKNSSRYADVLILTSEDPRSESVDQINREIKSGIISKKVRILEIPNRKGAIENAINMAKKGDYVLITGKSHEKSMNYGKGEETWDEYKTVLTALKKRKK